tara:strand:- start:1891 stop:2154 length:264 start_codon:yes stop_codon:yes gene_type:complete
MLIICGKGVPIEICEKIQNYIFNIKCLENRLNDNLLLDINKIRYYMDKSRNNLEFFNYEERTINWFASYLKICRRVEKISDIQMYII